MCSHTLIQFKICSLEFLCLLPLLMLELAAMCEVFLYDAIVSYMNTKTMAEIGGKKHFACSKTLREHLHQFLN